jgi:hypothetical protein
VPVRSQLGAAVFSKALRAKDIKSAKKDAAAASASPPPPSHNLTMGDAGANMMGIDVDCISQFVALHVNVPTNAVVFLEACGFLAAVLGALPMLAGVAGMLAVVGLSWWCMARYAWAQRGLMAARDAKTAVVSEALAGIRQIKSAALEGLWEGRIGAARSAELEWLARVFVAQAVVTVSALGVPIVLTVVSFATYGRLVGPPSAADVFGGCFLSARRVVMPLLLPWGFLLLLF